MTNEEAISELKDIMINALDFVDERTKRAFDMAIEALKKQIPSKVNYIGDGYADGELVYDEAECPSCGYIFDDCESDWERKFCPECGKALEWDSDTIS